MNKLMIVWLMFFCCAGAMADGVNDVLTYELAAERYNYPTPKESYTWKQLKAKVKDEEWAGSLRWRHSARKHEEVAFTRNGLYYIAQPYSTDVLTADGYLITDMRPFLPPIRDRWELYLRVTEGSAQAAVYDERVAGIRGFRLEKLGEEEYVVSVLDPLVTEKGEAKRKFRLIKGYIKGDKVLVTWNQHYGLGRYLEEHPQETEASFREKQLEAARTLYQYYFGTGIKTREIREEDKQRKQRCDKRRGQDSRWLTWAITPAWRRDWKTRQKKEPGSFITEFWERHSLMPGVIRKDSKLPEASQEAVFPNVNEGVGTGKSALKLFSRTLGRKLKSAKSYGGRVMYFEKAWDGNVPIIYIICHYYREKEADRAMLSMTPYDAGLSSRVPMKEDMAASLEMNPGRVGDRDAWLKSSLDENGREIPKSNRSAAFFIRGNTAVALIAGDVAYNVLPLARAIDKQLAEGMKKAGQSLKREQGYLKDKQSK